MLLTVPVVSGALGVWGNGVYAHFVRLVMQSVCCAVQCDIQHICETIHFFNDVLDCITFNCLQVFYPCSHIMKMICPL